MNVIEGVYDLVNSFLYEFRGYQGPRSGIDVFALLFASAVEAMVPTHRIVEAADIDLNREWERSIEQEIIAAHSNHLRAIWKPVDNALREMRPYRDYKKLHIRALEASKSYGETIRSYVEYRQLFLSDEYAKTKYYRKRREGLMWDKVSSRCCRTLLRDLDRIRVRNPEAFILLAPTDNVLDGIGEIILGSPAEGAVSPFD